LYIAIAAILCVAAACRFVALGRVPLVLSDEVFAAVDLHSLLTTGDHFNGARDGLLAYIVPAIDGRFLASLMLGSQIVDLRAVSAAFGVSTVAMMIPLGVELGDLALGVIAAAVLAIMPWDIYFSRIFFPASEYVFLTVLAVTLALRALRKRSVLAAIGCAVAAVGSVYIYPVAIVATPLLLAIVLVVRHRQLTVFGFRRTATACAIATALLIPYLIDRLVVTDQTVGIQNEVIRLKMIWNHGLSIWQQTDLFLHTWLTYMSVSFTILTGDPNVRESIQVMGSLGWAVGVIGWFGVALALGRRSPTDRLLLMWLAAFPVADALTFYDASANSIRGSSGAFIWALLAATTILAVIRRTRSWPRVGILSVLSLAMVVQLFVFASVYFGRYDQEYAYAFETGYPRIYSVLRQNGLQSIPITLHAGWWRDAMLQYFSNYRLHASEQLLSCYDLPYNVIHYTMPPRIFVIREDPDVQTLPGCIHDGLISRDRAALLQVSPRPVESLRKLDVVEVFPDDTSGRYFTAVFYLHY
jgi:4-amino-4-deoxy-L-arabinose transferase-like glycosyltransferase